MDRTVRAVAVAVAVTILISLRWRAHDARDCHHRTRFFGHERFTDAPRCDGSHGLGGQELRFRTHKYTERALVSGGSRRRQRLSAQD
jgi:hypothetical protein